MGSGLLNGAGAQLELQALSRTAHSQLLCPTLGISRRYSRNNFLVDLDFTLDFCRTDDLRNCMVLKENAKNPRKSGYHYKYLTDGKNDHRHVLSM